MRKERCWDGLWASTRKFCVKKFQISLLSLFARLLCLPLLATRVPRQRFHSHVLLTHHCLLMPRKCQSTANLLLSRRPHTLGRAHRVELPARHFLARGQTPLCASAAQNTRDARRIPRCVLHTMPHMKSLLCSKISVMMTNAAMSIFCRLVISDPLFVGGGLF